MAKPEPALLDPARYPFRCDIETRYRDLDSNLHINNGAFASLLEEGRVRFHRESGFNDVSASLKLTMMVASIGIEFIGQSHFPAPLDMHVACSHIGRSSNRLSQLVLQEGTVVAYAEVTLVCIEGDRPCAIPAEFRAELARWMLKS